MVDLMKHNKLNLNDLSKRIMDCNGDYRLFCIDVDDVVFNVAPIMQEILKRIDFRATNEYRERISKLTPEAYEEEKRKSFLILNAILEETKCKIENDNGITIKTQELDFTSPIINYEELYSDCNLFPYAVEYINYLLENRNKNDFFIFASHRNPEREGEIKTRRLYELFPKIDGVITLPFHKELGAAKSNPKSLCVMQTLQLDNLNNAWLIDNSKPNCKDFRSNSGRSIGYIPDGFNEYDSLDDHMSKLVNLDPFNLQFCLSYIQHVIKHPEYVDEIKAREAKIKRK